MAKRQFVQGTEALRLAEGGATLLVLSLQHGWITASSQALERAWRMTEHARWIYGVRV